MFPKIGAKHLLQKILKASSRYKVLDRFFTVEEDFLITVSIIIIIKNNNNNNNNNNIFTKRYDKDYKDIQSLISSSVDKVEAAAIQKCNKRRGHLKLFHFFFNSTDIFKY